MEHMMSKEEAQIAFQNLVASGVIKLCVHHKVKDKVLKLSVNTPEECHNLSLFFKESQPVYAAGDIFTEWFFYPNKDQLGDFAPTIARADIKYYWGLVDTRMSYPGATA